MNPRIYHRHSGRKNGQRARFYCFTHRGHVYNAFFYLRGVLHV